MIFMGLINYIAHKINWGAIMCGIYAQFGSFKINDALKCLKNLNIEDMILMELVMRIIKFIRI